MTSKEALSDIRWNVSMSQDLNYKENNDYCNIIEKDLEVLEKLRDIEEELGFDLVYATELCKKINAQKFVYTKEDWGIYKLEFLDDLDIELFNGRLYSNTRGVYVSLKIKDYGKTWSLIKEVLE